jgi:hypothetical protein
VSDLLVRVMHASLEVFDSTAQKTVDVAKIFDRAARRDVAWITGTEAGEDPLKSIVRTAAATHGYTFALYKGNFVCVRKSFLKTGSYGHGGHTVVDNDEVFGPGHDLNYVWAEFDHKTLGHITVVGSHYATKGRQGDVTPLYRRNTEENLRLATAIGKFMVKQGEGAALSFYGGDQNDTDKLQDTFFGQPVTSLWDELQHYETTGHGPIDVIASYDRDGRVKGASINALNDREFSLHSDHYLVEGSFLIRPL